MIAEAKHARAVEYGKKLFLEEDESSRLRFKSPFAFKNENTWSGYTRTDPNKKDRQLPITVTQAITILSTEMVGTVPPIRDMYESMIEALRDEDPDAYIMDVKNKWEAEAGK